MPRSTISSVLSFVRSWRVPSISATTVPALGRSKPITHFISVLLPLPLVPRSATVWPLSTAIDISSSTRTPPYPAERPSMRSLLAKIGSLDCGMAHAPARRPVGNLGAGDEKDEPLGEAHHRAHDVLDEDDGDARLVELHQQRQDVVDLGMREAGH